MKHNVFISDCENATIVINKKANNLTIENCHRVSVIVKDLIAAAEIIRSNGIRLQATGSVNSFTMDSCNETTIFLSQGSRGASLASSRCGGCNVSFVKEGTEDEWIEVAVPEQFVHQLTGDKLDTKVSDLYS
eukprot:GHVU01120036.1.p1 GENE.GHVU01120036.1~~GHVU01120036.1.p1  ORF type:complete len:132 (+),score=27.21 GHVU01120036.1:750-1145(+)